MKYSKEQIASIIKKSRENAGLTQAQVAERVGKKQQTVASWEIGQSQPDANMLFTLFDMFGTSVDEAFGFGQNQKAPTITLEPNSIEYDLVNHFRNASPVDRQSILRFALLAAVSNQSSFAEDRLSDEELAVKALIELGDSQLADLEAVLKQHT